MCFDWATGWRIAYPESGLTRDSLPTSSCSVSSARKRTSKLTCEVPCIWGNAVHLDNLQRQQILRVFRSLGTTPISGKKPSRSEKAILGALGEFRGILGAALGIQKLILGMQNSILRMASHDLSNTKTTILGATLGAIPGIDGNPHERLSFDTAFSEHFFNNWGGPRAPEFFTADRGSKDLLTGTCDPPSREIQSCELEDCTSRVVTKTVGLNAQNRDDLKSQSNRSDFKSQNASKIAAKIASKSVENECGNRS